MLCNERTEDIIWDMMLRNSKPELILKAGNIWLILNILLTMQYLSNMTKGTYDQKFIIPFLIIGWVPYIIGVL